MSKPLCYRWRLCLIALLCSLWIAPALAQSRGIVTVAAASDLKFAMDELMLRYAQVTGERVRAVYGSSGQFFTQIVQGAPFDLFMSADEAFIDQLVSQKKIQDRGALYAVGRIVLFTPRASPVRADVELADLRRALADGRLRKLALANPEHAPYGRAARDVLTNAGLWDAAQPHLVLGENVSQAAQFAASGSAQAGIFAFSLALAPQLAAAGSYVLIPESQHQPLRQRMALTQRGGSDARAFYDWLQQPDARTIFRRHGFTVPGER